MRIVFCGTPEFAAVSLRAVVAAGHEIVLVLTQPDKPAGRRLELTPSAVKSAALSLRLAVASPTRVKTNTELQAQLEELRPDACCVVAYGRILPPWFLAVPRFGCINVHGSLLPQYRGAAPIQWALANGEAETGVTTMLLNEGMDTGDMLLFHRRQLTGVETAAEMFPLLAVDGAALLVETLGRLEVGGVAATPQDDREATYAPMLVREDGRFLASRTAAETYNRWRGFQPWPGCWGEFRGRRLVLEHIEPADAGMDVPDGELRRAEGSLLLGCANGSALRLLRVKPEGKAAMNGVEFARGYQLKAGERLD